MSRHKFPETHGLWRSHKAEYRCWQDMIQRCHNPSNSSWHLYGERGIRVCDRWLESFVNFYQDMGKRPDGMSLDRINNDGPYDPKNCRWATAKTQARNHRGCVFIEHMGKRQTIAEWAEEVGIDAITLRSRYKRGLTAEQLFSKTMFNQHKARPNSKSRLLGVSAHRKKWKSQINVNGHYRYLGLFNTPEEAHAAYVAARSKLKEKNHE